MGFRMRKSKTIVPGVRISTTGKSASISFGGKAGRVTVNSSGRVTKPPMFPARMFPTFPALAAVIPLGILPARLATPLQKNTTAQN